ncbi:MAG TPA: cupin domain-containing protein [Chloroflexota bacterium]
MTLKKVQELPGVEIPVPHRRVLRTVYSPEQDPDLVGDLTFFRCDIFPHSSADRHSHEKSGEIMYVISGHGEGVLGDVVYKLEPDSAFYAPPGVPHQTRNTGDEMLRMVTLFSPAVGTAYARAKAAETK